MYSKEELKALDKVSRKVLGVPFAALNDDDKDMIYCYAADNGMV